MLQKRVKNSRQLGPKDKGKTQRNARYGIVLQDVESILSCREIDQN
jgi:hypothetical protein